MFPLILAKEQQPVEIITITGNQDVKHRLEKMGFLPGVQCLVFQNNNGNLIVQLLDCKIGLSLELSKYIMVKEICHEIK